jgi:uncharacterized membrane protein
MRWNVKREIFPLIVLVLYGILSLYFNSVLPERVPSHFDVNGTPDGYSSKLFLILVNAGIGVSIYLLLTFIPFIDPFWQKIQNRYSIFLMLRDIVLLFFLFLSALILYSAHQGRFRTDLMGVGFGLFFILLGNYLPKLPRNFFFGIRVPWTLSSEVVWRKTHQFGGWCMVLGGILMAGLSLLGVGLLLLMMAILLPFVVIVGLVYPLVLYKKLMRSNTITTPQL